LSLLVCFLTGRSDPANTALSPDQVGFLDALPLAAHERLDVNFPYAPASGAWRRTPLPVASVRNTRDYLASRRAAFAREHSDTVREVLARADRTLVLAGSCGLELLANLRLAANELADVHVLAYGPVARRRPPASLETVVGRRDRLARQGGAIPADHLIGAGHLDYLGSPEFRGIAARAVERLRAASRPRIEAQPTAGDAGTAR
jgi:hypothetical protein